jgi:hypothetical protein
MSTFDVKLKQLLMTCKRTDSVLDSTKDTAIKRQLEALKALKNEVETSRRGVEALKIEQKVNEDEVATWNSQVETELESERRCEALGEMAGRLQTGKGEKCFRRDIEIQDKNWETWNLDQLAEAVRLWIRRNPVDHSRDDDQTKKRRERERMYLTNRTDKPRECIYCDSSEHKAVECTNVTAVADRKQILAKKRLCFNCAVWTHWATQCQSKTSCQTCHKRHHTSICDKTQPQEIKKVVLTVTPSGVGEGVFPVILLKVDGIITRALIDTGAGSSYISAKVGDLLNKKPSDASTKRIEMLMGSHLT